MSGKSISSGLSRRKFLQTTAATAALAAVGNKLLGEPLSTMVANAAPKTGETLTKPGFCRMCHRTYCPTLHEVSQGVVTRIKGDPRWPWSEGRLCVRGNATLSHLYNPYRIKTPLKRTNPKKGLDVDPGWVEISWDEGLNTVARKLQAIRRDDPRKFIFFSGFGGDYTLFPRAFSQAFGTPNGLSATGAMCSVHWASGQAHATSTEQVDPGYCNYCITIGNTLGPNFAPAEPSSLDIVDAVERGMRTIVVDPRCSVEASKGEWVPIRPGTELAFLLAMGNVILYELNTYDDWFLKNRSNGPYLIDPDGNYLRHAASNKPLVWDSVENKAKPFDDPTIKDYALEGGFTVKGVQTQPAFSILKAHLKPYTPEWAQDITTIPGKNIRRITREYVEAARIGSTIEIDGFTFPYRPAAISIGRGLTGHYLGHLAYWMAMVVNTLVGAMDVPGGDNGTEPGPVMKPDADGVVTPASKGVNAPNPFQFPPNRIDAAEFCYYGFSQGFRMVDVILDPEKYHLEYKPEVMLTFGTNLYTKAAAESERISEALRRIPFIASISYHLDEHTAFADIVLPESSILERTLMATITERKCWSLARPNFTGSLVQQPVVPAMYQSRQADAILLDLAERAGILKGKGGLNHVLNRELGEDYRLALDGKYTVDEIVDRMLKSRYGPNKGLAAFKDVGFIARKIPPAKVFNYYYFPDNKTRHPIYNAALKKVGEDLLANLKEAGVTHPGWSEEEIRFHYQPVPTWRRGPAFAAPADFDLYSVVWKTAPFLFDISNTNGNPYLQEVSANDPYFGQLLINPKTAAKKGLKDGDRVWVESQFGGKIGPVPVRITELVHPEVAGVASGLARRAFGMNPIIGNGIPYNRLLSTRWETVDIITAAIESSPRVKLYKA